MLTTVKIILLTPTKIHFHYRPQILLYVFQVVIYPKYSIFKSVQISNTTNFSPQLLKTQMVGTSLLQNAYNIHSEVLSQDMYRPQNLMHT
jgi:hypothetical protein